MQEFDYKGLKKTPIRSQIIHYLKEQSLPTPLSVLEKVCTVSFDRATFFRTLKTFEQKGIAHRIIGTDGQILIALGAINNTLNTQKKHIHFNCSQCEKTFCIEADVTITNLPFNFHSNSFEIGIKGLCNQCTVPTVKN